MDGTRASVTDSQGHRYSVEIPSDTSTLAQELTLKGVDVTYQGSDGGACLQLLLLGVLPVLLIGGTLWLVMRRARALAGQHVLRALASSRNGRREETIDAWELDGIVAESHEPTVESAA